MSRRPLSPKTARLSVSLDEQTYRTLCAIAQQDDVSVAWVVRRAVGELVKTRMAANEGKTRQAAGSTARQGAGNGCNSIDHNSASACLSRTLARSRSCQGGGGGRD